MKVSIVTPVFNGVDFIEDCIRSVSCQHYEDLEYIVIDGGSTDGTVELLKRYEDRIDIFQSRPDLGMYDALNTGIGLASGDIIGVLNADDWFADSDVIAAVVHAFRRNSCDAVYGNMRIVRRRNPAVEVRSWNAGPHDRVDLEWGWMPAHPTLYLKKQVFDAFGDYALDLGCSADYEMVLRLFYTHSIRAFCLNKLMVIMRAGGMSNRTLFCRLQLLVGDYFALKSNQVKWPLKVIVVKRLRKFKQYQPWSYLLS